MAISTELRLSAASVFLNLRNQLTVAVRLLIIALNILPMRRKSMIQKKGDPDDIIYIII